MACKTSHMLCALFSDALYAVLTSKEKIPLLETHLSGAFVPFESLVNSTLSSKIILCAHVNQIADRHLIHLCGTDVIKGLHIHNPRTLPEQSTQLEAGLLNTSHLTTENLRGCVNHMDRLCHSFVQESINVFDNTRVLISHDTNLHNKLDDYQDKMTGCYAAFYFENQLLLSRKHLRPFMSLHLDHK